MAFEKGRQDRFYVSITLELVWDNTALMAALLTRGG